MPGVAVDVGDRAFGRRGVDEPTVERVEAGLLAQRRDIDRAAPVDRGNDGKFGRTAGKLAVLPFQRRRLGVAHAYSLIGREMKPLHPPKPCGHLLEVHRLNASADRPPRDTGVIRRRERETHVDGRILAVERARRDEDAAVGEPRDGRPASLRHASPTGRGRHRCRRSGSPRPRGQRSSCSATPARRPRAGRRRGRHCRVRPPWPPAREPEASVRGVCERPASLGDQVAASRDESGPVACEVRLLAQRVHRRARGPASPRCTAGRGWTVRASCVASGPLTQLSSA